MTPQDLPERVVSLQSERRRLEQEISKLRQQLATGGAAQRPTRPRRSPASASPAARSRTCPHATCAAWSMRCSARSAPGVAAVVSVTEGKAALVVKVSDDLKGSVSAVELVKAGVAELGGKGGGGRPDFAQGGGPDGARAEAALAAIERGLAGHAAAAE